MPLTLWRADYEIGVESIDTDHIVLFGLINHLDDCLSDGNDARAVRGILDVLVLHAIAHFGREEALMKRFAYPHMESHVREHHKIAERLQALIAEYAKSPSDAVSRQIVDVLAAWVNEHVMKADRRMRPFLKGRAR